MTMKPSAPTKATVLLKPGETERILAGHPWIYAGSILRITQAVEDGDIVQIKDYRQRYLGQGFYNTKSRIAVRMITDDKDPVDEKFLEKRLKRALDQRRKDFPEASSFRWVNSESDFLSGLIIDIYEKTVVFQVSAVGMEKWKPTLLSLIESILQPTAILERGDLASRKHEGLPLFDLQVHKGELTEETVVRLNGLEFGINLATGHKTGLYLDQQENYKEVAKWTKGAKCLDCFSFIGGFSIHAAAAGAASVLGLDQSALAVEQAQKNAKRNGFDNLCRFESVNVFDWLKANSRGLSDTNPSRYFDVIILDPPSFTRNRKSVPEALRGYKEIHLRALHMLKPGGLLFTFCCSHHVDAALFQEVIFAAAADAKKRLRRVQYYAQGLDHPILSSVPESEYLKGFAFEVLV